jgi:nucleoside-diphosphate-sugar epimerase
VGANLARRLLRDGVDVHCLVRPGHDPWRLEEVRGDVTLHEAELADAGAVAGVVGTVQPEWVFHLAVHGAYSWQTDVDAMVRTNVLGTVALAQACIASGVPVLVNTGSSSEYGRKDHPPAETDWLDPESDYAWTKAAATHACRQWGRRHGRRFVTLRLYTAYGPWEDPGRLVPTLIVHGLGGALPPLTRPETARDWVYVEDVCDAYVRAATRPDVPPGAVLNVGSGVQTSLRDVVEVARQVLGIAQVPRWGAMRDRAWDTSTWVADPRAIATTLGWQARTSLAEGLRRTVEWLRARPALTARYGTHVAPD